MGVIGPASLQSVRIDCNLFGRLKWREAVNVQSDELRAFFRISAASLYKFPICKLRDGLTLSSTSYHCLQSMNLGLSHTEEQKKTKDNRNIIYMFA